MQKLRLYLAFIFILIVSLLFFPATSDAQDDELVLAEPVSERYSLEVPADWITSNEEIPGLQGVLLGEIVVLADSEEALESLRRNSPGSTVIGQTLIANIFPAALGYTEGPTTSVETLFEAILGPDISIAERVEISGFPAAHVPGYFGPPYEQAAFSGQTAVIADDLVYLFVYAGPDEASLANLRGITETLTLNELDTSLALNPELLGDRPPFEMPDGGLSIDMAPTWMVADARGDATNTFFIVPEPDNTLEFIFSPDPAALLRGVVVQVESYRYEDLFGRADIEPTVEDRSFVLSQAMAALSAESAGNSIETELDGKPALYLEATNVFGGENHGQFWVVDADDRMYSLAFVAPAGRWEADYLPLVEAMLASVEVVSPLAAETDSEDVPVGTQVGQQAPDFEVTLLDGSQAALSDYRGQVVLLNFWATWCGPCRIEMPEFQTAYEAYQDEDFVVLAVNFQESAEQASDFAEEFGLTFPIALDPDGSVNRQFSVFAYPSSFVIDRQGVIQVSHAGPATTEQIDGWLEIVE